MVFSGGVFDVKYLVRITKSDDSPISLDAPLALRERGWG